MFYIYVLCRPVVLLSKLDSSITSLIVPNCGRDKEGGEGKVKKVKKSIPAWATLPSVKRTGQKTAVQHPKLHDILIEAIQVCFGQTIAPTRIHSLPGIIGGDFDDQ